ncbi:MAG: hypothetical protein HY703_04810 [Gemmatimonadetes bacterium]|nr:hypothetical protein [Gemmatimonadota bacterium]
MSELAIVGLTLRAAQRRILALLAFAALFLAAGAAARLLVGAEHGGVEIDRLFLVGGYPLVSALLLLGWLLGHFPLIATLVLVAGLVSGERADGHARLFYVRPVSPLRLYATRLAVLGLQAFLICALLLPGFDLLLLGEWAGPATLVLIAAYILVYGSLTALLSVWTRGDAWIALLLAILALVWDALRRAQALAIPAGVQDFISFVLPPQAALFRLEGAFARVQPIPWDAFAYAAGYALVMLGFAALSFAHREV